MGWATSWATFLLTHLVTLEANKLENTKAQTRRKGEADKIRKVLTCRL
jgi:hypothetical protein